MRASMCFVCRKRMYGNIQLMGNSDISKNQIMADYFLKSPSTQINERILMKRCSSEHNIIDCSVGCCCYYCTILLERATQL